MKKLLLSLGILFSVCSFAQSPTFYLGNSLRFLDTNNDTVPFPFIGGFVAPQFSEIDLNNDGVKDLFVFDRSGNKKMTFLNEGKAGQVSYIYAPKYEYSFPELARWVLLRDYNCDGKEDIFTGSEQSGFTVYKNVGTADSLQFEHIVYDLTDTTGGNMYNLTLDIPAIDDVDGDGDLDILAFGVLGGYVQYYRNERVEKGLDCDALNFNFVDFCWGSFVEAGLTNDIILGDNCFGLKFYKNQLHSGSTVMTFDADEDGDKDMLIGDIGFPDFKFLMNGKKETSWPYDTVTSYTTHYPQNTLGVYIDLFPAAYYLDLNNDGVKDLIASSNEANSASNLGQNWWYKNNGKTNKPDLAFQDSSFLQDMTIDFGSQTSPALFDMDGDGDLDLVLANRGNYRDTRNSNDRLALFENVGTSQKAIFKLKSEDYLGLSNDSITGMNPTFADLNGDGKQDLIIGQINGRLKYYVNTGTATVPAFTLQNDTLGSIDVGTLSAPHFYDLDGDTVLDLFVGNSTGFVKYYKNHGTRNIPNFLSQPTVDSVGKIRVADFFYNYGNFDPNGNPIDSTKTFEYEGHSTPWIADLDNDGNPEILSGSRGGKIFIYPLDKNNLTDSFPSLTEYFIQPHNQSGGIVDLGGRTSLALMDVGDDGRLDILVGNSRGGIHYLSSSFSAEDTLNSIGGILPLLDLTAYPNPTEGALYLKHEQSLNAYLKVEVIDVLGRTRLVESWNPSTESTKALALNSLANGTYFVVVSHPDYRTNTLRVTVVK